MRVDPTAVPPPTQGPSPTAGSSDLSRVAREFESMLVRQLLETSHAAPGGSTQQGMCLDAFAQGIADRGGLGLAQQLEAVLRAASEGPRRG